MLNQEWTNHFWDKIWPKVDDGSLENIGFLEGRVTSPEIAPLSPTPLGMSEDKFTVGIENGKISGRLLVVYQ